jgi:hypothetical protein
MNGTSGKSLLNYQGMKVTGIFANAQLDTVVLPFSPNFSQYHHSKTVSSDSSVNKEESLPYNMNSFI